MSSPLLERAHAALMLSEAAKKLHDSDHFEASSALANEAAALFKSAEGEAGTQPSTNPAAGIGTASTPGTAEEACDCAGCQLSDALDELMRPGERTRTDLEKRLAATFDIAESRVSINTKTGEFSIDGKPQGLVRRMS